MARLQCLYQKEYHHCRVNNSSPFLVIGWPIGWHCSHLKVLKIAHNLLSYVTAIPYLSRLLSIAFFFVFSILGVHQSYFLEVKNKFSYTCQKEKQVKNPWRLENCRMVDFPCKMSPTFLQFLVAGYQCSGPCEIGYRCSPNCKESAKEVEEMHDDCHYFAPAYCNHRRTLNFETMEEVINRGKWTLICSLSHSYQLPIVYINQKDNYCYKVYGFFLFFSFSI